MQELAESEDVDASVSRGILMAYMRNVGNDNGRPAGGKAAAAAAVGNGVSLERWLEDRHIARKKVRAGGGGHSRVYGHNIARHGKNMHKITLDPTQHKGQRIL